MKYYLHYVGNKLYPKEIFIKEAQAIGVNRCLPTKMIKKLKWGDRLLLGTYIPDENYKQKQIEILNKQQNEKNEFANISPKDIDGRKNKKNGTADIFGYFILTGLNYNASNDFKQRLIEQLDIVNSSDVNERVQRRCGGYTIGTSYIVRDSIKDIINKAEQLAKEMNEQVKFFVAGRFNSLNLTINPINFSRAILEVEIKDGIKTDIETKGFDNRMAYIYDYNKRSYIKTYAKRGRPRKEKNENKI